MIQDKSSAMNDQKLANVLGGHALTTGGLAIKTGSSPTVITASTVYYMIAGVLYSESAGDMAALTGTITTGYSNVAVFYVDTDGDVATAMGTQATTVAGIVFPEIPDNVAIIGFLLISNATGSVFTCGTTALDIGSVTTVYVNTTYPVHFTGVSV